MFKFQLKYVSRVQDCNILRILCSLPTHDILNNTVVIHGNKQKIGFTSIKEKKRKMEKWKKHYHILSQHCQYEMKKKNRTHFLKPYSHKFVQK